MIDLLFGPRTGFVTAAYGVTALVLLMLVAWVVHDRAKQRHALKALEEGGVTRAAQKADKP